MRKKHFLFDEKCDRIFKNLKLIVFKAEDDKWVLENKVTIDFY